MDQGPMVPGGQLLVLQENDQSPLLLLPEKVRDRLQTLHVSVHGTCCTLILEEFCVDKSMEVLLKIC